MRIALVLVGAILGLALASERTLLGVFVGALGGLVLAEAALLRQRLSDTQNELNALKKLVARLRRDIEESASAPAGEAGATAPAPATTPAPAATPPAPGRSAPSPAWTPTPGLTPAPRPAQSSEAAGSEWRGRPDVFETAWRVVRGYFTGGNTLVRAGVIVLFFGVAFLLRYVAEHSRIPIELRLCGVALGGIVLLLLGWRLRRRRAGYALALQGGAVGILYLTVFAALRLYSLLPSAVAFGLLIVIAVLSAALAVLQDSQAFALLGATGGWLAPILASTGQGSHVVLFSYYAVLNLGLVPIAWFKAWRPLNVAGFLFTFAVGTVWGVLRYRPELFASTEPFLILFFLLYVAIAVLFTERQPPELRGYVDGTLVFGTPLAAFGLQTALLPDRRFALAFSALAVSALYLALAALLHRRRRDSQRLLIEAFMALGVLFLTLAVPLALDGRWSSATWAFEGAALVWIGCRQHRQLPRVFGAVLQLAGGVIFWTDRSVPPDFLPVLNSACLGGMMVSAASVFSAARLARYERLSPYEAPLGPALFFWGLLWWSFSGLTEIQRSVPDRYDATAGLIFVTATALLSSELHQRARIKVARLPALWLLPAMALYALLAIAELRHPLEDGGWLAWPCAFAALYCLFRRHEARADGGLARTLHVGAAWLLVALTCWEVAWAVNKGVQGSGSWPAIAWALVPSVALFALVRAANRSDWPIGVHRQSYVAVAGGGLAVYLVCWSLATNFTFSGDPYPLPFVPLLNPLDLAEGFVLLVLLRYWLHLRTARYPALARVGRVPVLGSLATLTFVWLTAALLRTLHHWAGVPLSAQAIVRSTLVQTSVSIFWAVLALASMLVATRKGARIVWLVGATLLGVVIAKLFLVDLSRVGTIERIVSFVVVGVLMLVVGYFSPLPPQPASDANK